MSCAIDYGQIANYDIEFGPRTLVSNMFDRAKKINKNRGRSLTKRDCDRYTEVSGYATDEEISCSTRLISLRRQRRFPLKTYVGGVGIYV